jgi:hypothetical protein
MSLSGNPSTHMFRVEYVFYGNIGTYTKHILDDNIHSYRCENLKSHY